MPIGFSKLRLAPNGGTGQNPTTMAGLLALVPPGRLNSINPILPYLGSGWKSGQTFEYVIVPKPGDPTHLYMYYCGEYNGGSGGGIGLAIASASTPTVWTDQVSVNPLVYNIPNGTGQVRLGDVVWDPVTSVFNMYVSSDNVTMDLFTSPDGLTWTAYSGNPVWQSSQVIGITGVYEVSNMGVLRADATHWYGYYSHRSTQLGTLPSIRLATSPDGKSWTDANVTLWSTLTGTYYSKYLEGRNQILQTPDGNYAIVTSCYNNTNWVMGMATSSAPNTAFTPLAIPMFTASGVLGSFDSSLVASGAIYNLNGKWFLFYSGSQVPGIGNYGSGFWSTGIAEF